MKQGSEGVLRWMCYRLYACADRQIAEEVDQAQLQELQARSKQVGGTEVGSQSEPRHPEPVWMEEAA